MGTNVKVKFFPVHVMKLDGGMVVELYSVLDCAQVGVGGHFHSPPVYSRNQLNRRVGGPRSGSRRFRGPTGTELFLESPSCNDATVPTTSVLPILSCRRNSFALKVLLRNPQRKFYMKLQYISQTT